MDGETAEDHGTFTVETKGETATLGENGRDDAGVSIENVPAIVGTAVNDYISEI